MSKSIATATASIATNANSQHFNCVQGPSATHVARTGRHASPPTARPLTTALAADAVDKAFARALERWERVGAMTSPTGWTLQVARNVSRRARRRAALERRLLLRAPAPVDVPPPAGELWQLVAQLPQRRSGR